VSNDTWRTPPEIFNYFNMGYDFKIDVCASKENSLCPDYIDQDEDALKADWLHKGLNRRKGTYVWMNPPYSKPLPFVERAINQSQLNGVGCVALLNNDFSTKWGTLLTIYQCTIINITGGRIAFLNDFGKPVKGNPKSQIVVIIPPYVRIGDPVTKYLPLKTIMLVGALKEAAWKQ
jgi:phage N-6-adenine-methyltransferase